MLRRLFTLLGFAIIVPLTVLGLMGNWRLYSGGSGRVLDRERVRKEILPQLRFLRAELDHGSAETMQELFPEGYFFNYALYGLTWVEVGLREEPGSPLYQEALRESRWALANLDSEKGKGVFPRGLNPPYGAFYQGWKTWLHGGILKLQPPSERDADEVRRFEESCEILAKSYEGGKRPFTSSYFGLTAPMDAIVGAAALRLHDHLLPPKYADLLTEWKRSAIAQYDPTYQLLPHQVPPPAGAYQMPRAIAQSVVCRFAYEIDPLWGREMYDRYRQYYFKMPLGIPGMREYPKGVNKLGDVDSGPLFLGLSASASAITIGTAQVYGDTDLAAALMNSAEAAGLPIRWGDQKIYCFGLVPVADGFIAWAKASQPWTTEGSIGTPAFKPLAPSWWRLVIHATTLLPWPSGGRPFSDLTGESWRHALSGGRI